MSGLGGTAPGSRKVLNNCFILRQTHPPHRHPSSGPHCRKHPNRAAPGERLRVWPQASGCPRQTSAPPELSLCLRGLREQTPAGKDHPQSTHCSGRIGAIQACGRRPRPLGRPRPLAGRGFLIFIPELRMCKACAAFPVTLVSSEAPGRPSAWLGAQESASMPSLPSPPRRRPLAHTLRARVLIQDRSTKGALIATATFPKLLGKESEA